MLLQRMRWRRLLFIYSANSLNEPISRFAAYRTWLLFNDALMAPSMLFPLDLPLISRQPAGPRSPLH